VRLVVDVGVVEEEDVEEAVVAEEDMSNVDHPTQK
jgi:hypothetical protein